MVADTDMASKLDIGCGYTYCTICSDMSIVWEHTLSSGTKEFVCAVWRRDEQWKDCGQALGHGMPGEEMKLASYSKHRRLLTQVVLRLDRWM
jgi:hypothetical protein